jgi:two-component system LytT family response regulator
MTIRVVIADDEPLARERVRVFLAEEPDIEVVAECGEGAATVEAVEQHCPHLLFLDVQMPRLSGFEVLEALDLQASAPAVIFTTAYDQHAIRAFEVNAVDYLLKPYNRARFKQAVQRARTQCQARSKTGLTPEVSALLASRRALEGGPRILVKSPGRILFLKAREIDHVEADGNYVQVYAGKDRYMIRETMATMEARLGPAGFMRLSRSVIANLSRVRELQPLGAGAYCVILQNGARLDMTCPLRELQERMDGV